MKGPADRQTDVFDVALTMTTVAGAERCSISLNPRHLYTYRKPCKILSRAKDGRELRNVEECQGIVNHSSCEHGYVGLGTMPETLFGPIWCGAGGGT